MTDEYHVNRIGRCENSSSRRDILRAEPHKCQSNMPDRRMLSGVLGEQAESEIGQYHWPHCTDFMLFVDGQLERVGSAGFGQRGAESRQRW